MPPSRGILSSELMGTCAIANQASATNWRQMLMIAPNRELSWRNDLNRADPLNDLVVARSITNLARWTG